MAERKASARSGGGSRPRRAPAGVAADNGSGETKPPLAVPDTVGDRGFSVLGAQQLLNLQTQRKSLEHMVLIDELEDSDIVPGITVRGNTITVANRRKQLDRAIGRLVAMHEEADSEGFRKAVEEVKKQQWGE